MLLAFEITRNRNYSHSKLLAIEITRNRYYSQSKLLVIKITRNRKFGVYQISFTLLSNYFVSKFCCTMPVQRGRGSNSTRASGRRSFVSGKQNCKWLQLKASTSFVRSDCFAGLVVSNMEKRTTSRFSPAIQSHKIVCTSD